MAKIVIRVDLNNLMMRSRYYLTMELGLVQGGVVQNESG